MKQFTKCKVLKPRSEFHKSKACKDGLYPQCKECVSISEKQRRKNDPEKARKKDREEYYRNFEKHSERARKYSKRNKPIIKEYYKKYSQTERGKERIRLAREKYKQTKKYNATKKAYNIKNKQEHPERYAARNEVTKATMSGKIPYPYTLKCVKCGKQAKQYHHYLGYLKKHWLDVDPVCIKCHNIIHNLYNLLPDKQNSCPFN